MNVHRIKLKFHLTCNDRMQSRGIANGFVFVKRHWWELVCQRGDFFDKKLKKLVNKKVRFWEFCYKATRKSLQFRINYDTKITIVHARHLCIYRKRKLAIKSKKNNNKKTFVFKVKCAIHKKKKKKNRESFIAKKTWYLFFTHKLEV